MLGLWKNPWQEHESSPEHELNMSKILETKSITLFLILYHIEKKKSDKKKAEKKSNLHIFTSLTKPFLRLSPKRVAIFSSKPENVQLKARINLDCPPQSIQLTMTNPCQELMRQQGMYVRW